MSLTRVLEPEVMASREEADQYNAMDHSEVNVAFVEDLLQVEPEPGDVLDLGAGTALIPIELCRRCETCRVMAADASIEMLEVARYNIEVAGLIERIQLEHLDAKRLPQRDGYFTTVMSNSLVHHLAEPIVALREAVRVTAPGGLLFFRDLFRPESEARLGQLVDAYAGQDTPLQREMFANSLRAALTVEEMRELVAQLGFDPDQVRATSDRHWTWTARKPAGEPGGREAEQGDERG